MTKPYNGIDFEPLTFDDLLEENGELQDQCDWLESENARLRAALAKLEEKK